MSEGLGFFWGIGWGIRLASSGLIAKTIGRVGSGQSVSDIHKEQEYLIGICKKE